MATKTHAFGSPSWFELSTTDQAGAEAFYGALFGWSVQRNPMGDYGHYTIFKLGDREVGACCGLMPEQQAQGVPPNWGIYFRVDDADATATAVDANGGRVLMAPFEVMEHLRMAVCADPEGAPFSLHQPRSHHGVEVVREPNAVLWVELATRDLDRAERFYGATLGWKLTAFEGSPTDYRIIDTADGSVGGMLKMTPEWGEMPSHWSIYFHVEDVDATLERAQSLGGATCVPAFDVPGVGRIARINDPAGAGFYVMKPMPRQ